MELFECVRCHGIREGRNGGASDMDIESAKAAILTEAAKQKNQIFKLKDNAGEYLKLKHSYSQPGDVRESYLLALNSLLNSGLVRQVFANDHLELFELTKEGAAKSTLAVAKSRLIKELESSGRVFKVHSDRGEFVQIGAESINSVDSERILYMQALHALFYHGIIKVASESREMATYELDRTKQDYFNQISQSDGAAA